MVWMKNYLEEREMRTVIRDSRSPWLRVTSGVPQGSVLGPIMFAVYVNDMVEGINSHISLFADDAKVMRKVRNDEDCVELQNDLQKLGEWGRKWNMEFNAEKCKVMEFGKSRNRVHHDYVLTGALLNKSTEEKDLGITISNNLSPDKHVERIVREANGLLKRIRMAFEYMDGEMMKKLICTMIRPKLEYAETVWSPHKKKNIRKLERVQRAATKMVPELKDMTYEERLKVLDLPTLEQRRERGDLISIYKIVSGMDKTGEELLTVEGRAMRGHNKRIRKERFRRDIKKFSFPHRVVDVWNGLPSKLVDAVSVHSFKEQLDLTRYSRREQ